VIWEPFVLALFLGLIVSAGLYFAYLWPSIEPLEEPATAAADSVTAAESAGGDDVRGDDDSPAAEAAEATAKADDATAKADDATAAEAKAADADADADAPASTPS